MPRSIEKIAIFCGAMKGDSDLYATEAQNLVDQLCAFGLTIVYGGGNLGLMGIIADRVLKNNGKIIGVIPQKLVDIEVAHKKLSDLRIVDSMEQRKALMIELADAFVMLPGGAGSLDEFFEVYTLAKLGYHNKPCAILNTNRYYDHLVAFLDHTTREGFVTRQDRDMIITSPSSEGLLAQLNICEL